jgi:hypothetical protein
MTTDLERRMAEQSTEELLEIWAKSADYTDEALSLAAAELDRRKVPLEDRERARALANPPAAPRVPERKREGEQRSFVQRFDRPIGLAVGLLAPAIVFVPLMSLGAHWDSAGFWWLMGPLWVMMIALVLFLWRRARWLAYGLLPWLCLPLAILILIYVLAGVGITG